MSIDESVELIRFPAGEKQARDYLLEALDDVEVSTEVPATRPARFVVVALAGGYRLNIATMVRRLVFECWATSKLDAQQLAGDVETVVLAWAERTDDVRKVEDGSLVYSRDPDSRSPRYVKTVEVHFRPEREG